MSRSPTPVTVHVPSQGSDRPSWVKVGVIAVVGFAVGVAWPRLAGIRPGPSAPGEGAANSASARAPEGPVSSAPAALASAGPAAASAAPLAPAPGAPSNSAAVPMNNAPPAVLVTRGAVLTCKTPEGEVLKGDKCGAVAQFDGLAQPRLKKLAYCPQAHGASGKLSVVFSLDFTRNKIGFSFGKTTTVDNKDSLDQCLRMSLENVSLNAVAHDNPLYGVFYSVTFTPRDSATLGGAAPVAAAGGAADTGGDSAQVAWEVAIVRDTPRTGSVVARLQRGAKVKVANGQDGWFRVRYGTDFGSEGWVYRGAIGK